MDSSRRAVGAYWRSLMIDGVTSDEDKVSPVYKLEEICELLRTSHASIVKEVSDYIFKRIDHKSPIVKQKTLRLIKYAVVKSGADFRMEMQRHSAVIRELFHYKGHQDPLKGDALNKAVRETAHEAVSTIFDSNDNNASQTVGIGNRIQGFGNTNYEMPTEEKRSFLSEVVDLGRASIEQGLSSITAAHSSRKNDNGSYKSPNLRSSLTAEIDTRDRYESDNRGSWASSGVSKNVSTGTWVADSTQSSIASSTNEDASLNRSGVKTREERLLETIVTPGGVLLQPTRDAIQGFLMEASKLDQLAMCHALESKLQSNLWQVRVKALCVLESLLRKKDDAQFSIVASYFSENRSSVVKCSDSPQVSLREKANKVLSLLVENTSATDSHPGEPSSRKCIPDPVVPLPDLIDTGGPDEYGSEDTKQEQTHQSNTNVISTGSLVDDLFGSEPITSTTNSGSTNEGDPFADVSFHVAEDKRHVDDLFSGLTVDERKSSNETNKFTSNHTPELLGIFYSEPVAHKKAEMHDFMPGLSMNEFAVENKQPGGASAGGTFSGPSTNLLDSIIPPSQSAGSEGPNIASSSQIIGIHPNVYLPVGSMEYNNAPNSIFDQAFAAQPMNYSGVGNFIGQQQLLSQNLGSFNARAPHDSSHDGDGSYSSPLPDIFQPSNSPVQYHNTTTSSAKKEETKAFNFISDHLSAARDPKRVL